MMLAIEDLSQFVWSASLLFAGYLVVTVFVLPHPFFSSTTRYLDSQSWAGLQKQQWFSRLRASVRSLTNTRAMVIEGYEKVSTADNPCHDHDDISGDWLTLFGMHQFSKTGKNWALAQFLSDPIIILPAQRLHEVMALSDEQLDHHGPNSNSFVPRYSTGEDVMDGPHIDVVRRQLTRRLPLLTADVHQELTLAMEQNWTPKEEWTTVAAYDSIMKIVSRAANRVFCGTELCRNPEFLEASRQYAIGAFRAGFKLKMFPKWTHPIAGPLAALPVTRSLAIAKRICTPIIKERLRHIQDPTLAKDYKAPNDALQWLLEDLVKRAGPGLKIDMDQTIRQLMMLNMVAIHTTSMVTTNTLLDLYSHPEAAMYVAGLREECERAFATEQKWSKDAVNKLIRVDSVIRETMRITTLADFLLKRSVQLSPQIINSRILSSNKTIFPIRSSLPPASRSRMVHTFRTA